MLEKADRRQLSRIDLNLLVLFDAMAAHLHVGDTAKFLNLTPSAVSHGLTRLRRLLNDPLFLKQPKGMTATERAKELREPIADILKNISAVLEASRPFVAATSRRAFRVGTSDGFSSQLVTIVKRVATEAPGVSLVITNLNRETALGDLDLGLCDVAIAPFDHVPRRFEARMLYEENFVVVTRRGHPTQQNRSLSTYCDYDHVLVAPRGIPRSPIDDLIEAKGYKRNIRTSVPNFFLALDLVQNSDLMSIMPAGFVKANNNQFDVETYELPLEIGRFVVKALAPKSALIDSGIRWLLDLITSTMTLSRDG